MREEKAAHRRLAERIRLCEEARRLQGKGLSNARISRILGVRQKQIDDWLDRGVRPRIYRYEPNLTPSPELAYLIGFWLGDGRNAGKEGKVRFKLADRWQLEHMNRLVARLLGREPKLVRMDGPFYTVDYDAVVLHDYLAQSLERLSSCIRPFMGDFLMGFFDAEGYVSCNVDISRQRLGNIVVGVANTDLAYLRLVRSLLFILGIKTSVRVTNKKGGSMTIRGITWVRKHDVNHLVIGEQKSVRKFFAVVGFTNPTKKEKLRDLVSLMELPPEQRFNWFVKHYERKGRRWYKKVAQLPN